MVAIYPDDAVFNVNVFAVTGSVQYNSTGTRTEFALPTTVTTVAQVLPYVDGIMQDTTTYSLSAPTGGGYANVAFSSSLYASNLTLKTISVPPAFYTTETSISTAVLTYSNAIPVTVRGNTYVTNGSRTTFALPILANTNNKDNIIVAREGINQAQDQFTFPSSTLGIYGIDMLEAPNAEDTLEIRVFDGGVSKTGRKTSMRYRKADKGFTYSHEMDVKTTKFIAGYEKRRLMTRRMKRKWDISYTNITGVEKEAIQNFYIARSGTFESFSFDLNHLNESGFATVIFDSPPKISHVLSGSPDNMLQNYYSVSMTLREVDD